MRLEHFMFYIKCSNLVYKLFKLIKMPIKASEEKHETCRKYTTVKL